MSQREAGSPEPSSPTSLLNVNRRNKEVAKAIKARLQRQDSERSAQRPPRESSPTSDIVLPDRTLGQGDTNNLSPLFHGIIEDMSKPVLFYGKPGQLDDVITHVNLRCLAEGKTEDSIKCGVLGSLYRGTALTWLTQYMLKNSLDDFEELVEQTRKTFGLPEEAEDGLNTKKLSGLRQTKSVQQYALAFRQLQLQVKLPPATAKQYFIRGLKPHIQRALVVSSAENDTLDSAIQEATRIDAEYYNIRSPGSHSGQNKGRGGKSRDKSGRFTAKREDA